MGNRPGLQGVLWGEEGWEPSKALANFQGRGETGIFGPLAPLLLLILITGVSSCYSGKICYHTRPSRA